MQACGSEKPGLAAADSWIRADGHTHACKLDEHPGWVAGSRVQGSGLLTCCRACRSSPPGPSFGGDKRTRGCLRTCPCAHEDPSTAAAPAKRLQGQTSEGGCPCMEDLQQWPGHSTCCNRRCQVLLRSVYRGRMIDELVWHKRHAYPATTVYHGTASAETATLRQGACTLCEHSIHEPAG